MAQHFVAKQQQLIPACAPLMAALREEGYYLSDGLVAAVVDGSEVVDTALAAWLDRAERSRG